MPALPPIDYTNLGYESMRDAMLALARERVPEWTDQSDNDLLRLLVDLTAFSSDINLYYQTRIAANLLPETSDEPDALIQLLRLIGYELRPPSAATANLRLAFGPVVVPPITIPSGTAFTVRLSSGQELNFESERDVQILGAQLTPPDALAQRHFFPLPVVEGRTVVNELIGVSDGSPNQRYPLGQKPVLANSIQITVAEPGGPARWQVVDTLAKSSPADRHCIAQRDAEGRAIILFGDGGSGVIGGNGMIPPRGTPVIPVTINATYRVGGGVIGNVPAESIFRSSLAVIADAVNPQAAAGGMEGEDLERARAFAPRLFRTQDRGVTRDDYRDLALQVPGVGKALAVAVSWNYVVLFIAPSGQVAEPSELLKRDLLEFLERQRMTTTGLRIVGPKPADIYLVADVQAQPYFRRVDVQEAVEKAVADYLAFDNVDFGRPIYLSRVYDAIQSLPEVASLNVTRFSRSPTGAIETDGQIKLAANELPRPGYRDNPNTLFDPLDPAYRPPIVANVKGGAVS
jgi:hypothetical protein